MSGGCSLKPFEITREESEELVLDLLIDPKSHFEVLDAPVEIQTYVQWVAWKLNHLK